MTISLPQTYGGAQICPNVHRGLGPPPRDLVHHYSLYPFASDGMGTESCPVPALDRQSGYPGISMPRVALSGGSDGPMDA